MDQVPQFSSKDDEIQYWKCLAVQYQKGLQDAREELDDFQENSRELEQELEAQLVQVDKRNRDLCSINNRLQLDLESTRDKLEQVQKETEAQISDMQTQLSAYRSREEEWHKYIRELEQANDDLERAKRAMLVSVEDFETRLNLAIERNAFLESELDEKESLRTMVQRLKDEARDMKQELQVRERDLPEEKCLEQGRNTLDSNKFTVEMETQTAIGSPLKSTQNSGSPPVVPLTPSARISTLNIVGDLIRKAGHPQQLLVHTLAAWLWFAGQKQTWWSSLRRGKTSAEISYADIETNKNPMVSVLQPSLTVSSMSLELEDGEALESKLASCRNLTKESPSHGDISNKDVLRGRRVNRTSMSPTVQSFIRI